MASGLYDKGREAYLSGALNWSSDTIKVVLVNVTGAGTLYTVNLATHQYLSDIASGARIATSGALTTKTVTAGVADADDVTITGVSGDTIEALVVYKDTGTASTSPLIAYIDNFTVNGGSPPLTPNGGDVTIQWDNGSNKIFKL